MLSSCEASRSALARGDSAALFSEASIDNGLPLSVEPREVGRCCHESVPERARGIAALGDGVDESGRAFEGGRGRSRGL